MITGRQIEKKVSIYEDVYDGKIWREFQTYHGEPFLENSFTYGLMLNIDWFKPCKHTEYSIGAIYLTVMNLPRNVRIKQENVLLIGLLPGLREPKHDVNAFLKPLVQELLKYWNGVEMRAHSFSENVYLFGVLYFVLHVTFQHREKCVFFWDIQLFLDVPSV